MATLHFEFCEIPTIDPADLDPSLSFVGGTLLAQGNTVASATAGDTGVVQAEELFGGLRHRFVFWTVSQRNTAVSTGSDRVYLRVPVHGAWDGFVAQGTSVRLTATPGADLVATAWFVRADADLGPGIRALGFDRGANRFIRGTPIESVSPPAAWTPGAHDVTTAGAAAVVTAWPAIVERIRSRGRSFEIEEMVFEAWQGPGLAVPAANQRTVAQGERGLAIAVYGRHRVTPFVPVLEVPATELPWDVGGLGTRLAAVEHGLARLLGRDSNE